MVPGEMLARAGSARAGGPLILMLGGYAGLFFAGLGADIWLIWKGVRGRGGTLAERARRVAGSPWREGDALLLVGLLGAALVLGWAVAGVMWRGYGGGRPLPADLIEQSVAFHWMIVGGVWCLLKARRMTWRRAFGISAAGIGRGVVQGVAAYCAMLPPLWAGTLLYRAGLRYWGYNPGLQEAARLVVEAGGPWLERGYLFFVAIVLAPLAEELLFRGIFLPLLLRRMRPWAAVAVVALFFAGVHLDLGSFVSLFVIAVGFGAAYIYSGSLIAPVVMHVLFNGVNLAMLILLD